MTITEQIRLKLKTVDRILQNIRLMDAVDSGTIRLSVDACRNILREICELDRESEE